MTDEDVCKCGRARGSSVHDDGAPNGRSFDPWQEPRAEAVDDEDTVTLYDVDDKVILQVYRRSGRAKIYVQAPNVPSTSIENDKARALAALINDTLVSAVGSEVADIEARLTMLRAASRPSEQLEDLRTVPAAWRSEHHVQTVSQPSAQGHILSAITQLERRRAELLGKAPR